MNEECGLANVGPPSEQTRWINCMYTIEHNKRCVYYMFSQWLQSEATHVRQCHVLPLPDMHAQMSLRPFEILRQKKQCTRHDATGQTGIASPSQPPSGQLR